MARLDSITARSPVKPILSFNKHYFFSELNDNERTIKFHLPCYFSCTKPAAKERSALYATKRTATRMRKIVINNADRAVD